MFFEKGPYQASSEIEKTIQELLDLKEKLEIYGIKERLKISEKIKELEQQDQYFEMLQFEMADVARLLEINQRLREKIHGGNK